VIGGLLLTRVDVARGRNDVEQAQEFNSDREARQIESVLGRELNTH
jgi:hypothetical protein